MVAQEAAFNRPRDFGRKRSAGAPASKWIAGLASFKAVLIEGAGGRIFILIAVFAGRGAASLGALGAFALVLIVRQLVHRPLAWVPENLLKFGVGIMLSAFGVFWTGEGLGVDWPGQDLTILGFIIV